jgi:type I restriction enzyme S subunit
MATPSVNLDPKHFKIVLNFLQLWVPNADVWVYGSRARGRVGPGSDLDLLIDNPGPKLETLSRLARLKRAFDDSDLPFSVDVTDANKGSPIFRETIDKEKIQIQKRS